MPDSARTLSPAQGTPKDTRRLRRGSPDPGPAASGRSPPRVLIGVGLEQGSSGFAGRSRHCCPRGEWVVGGDRLALQLHRAKDKHEWDVGAGVTARPGPTAPQGRRSRTRPRARQIYCLRTSADHYPGRNTSIGRFSDALNVVVRTDEAEGAQGARQNPKATDTINTPRPKRQPKRGARNDGGNRRARGSVCDGNFGRAL
jgi:hypothetical protein